MFSSKKVFVTIEFPDIDDLFDYPKHLPIPQAGDIVHLNGKSGKVDFVKHMTTGTVSTIAIKCKRGNGGKC